MLLWWVILLASIIVYFNTGEHGFFRQLRVGMDGRIFRIYKLRSMVSAVGVTTTVTTLYDKRITPFGRFLRRSKLDELPQLINVLIGDMSFVGPRPDVPGFADLLTEADKVILSIRPGLTGLASINFINEEKLLAEQSSPDEYNRRIIWPAKIRLNKFYILKYSFCLDIRILWLTFCRRFKFN